jgi:O-antigen/teichoic acid export membrane protein
LFVSTAGLSCAAPRSPWPGRRIKLFLALAITAAGLAGRSALDKVLALRGGAELVALWAQLASVIELLTGIASAGVATGLAIYVARTRVEERRQDFLREALRIGILVTFVVAAAIALAAPWTAHSLSGGRISAALLALAAAAGWLAVIAMVVNGLWLGQQHRGRMLALALFSAALPLAAAVFAPPERIAALVAIAHAVPAIAVLFAVKRSSGKPRFRESAHPLRRYILPGLVIGILSPASMLIARAAIGEGLSWQDVGVMQALWRVADWVCGFAAGALSLYFLPRFAAARGNLGAEMGRAAKLILLPAAAVFAVLFALHEPLLTLLYDETFHAPTTAAAFVFAGSLVRIASWIPLFALYAQRRTRAIAVGELFSLPLFALLTMLGASHLSLTLTAVLWLASFVAYLAFNWWAVRSGR